MLLAFLITAVQYMIMAKGLTGMTAKREKTVSRLHWLVMEGDGEADRVEV